MLVLNATPGADLLLTLGRSLQGGARAGLATALGINAGCVVHAMGAAFGLAALLAVQPGLFTALQWVGAAYLAWLGLGLWRQARHTAPAPAPALALALALALAPTSVSVSAMGSGGFDSAASAPPGGAGSQPLTMSAEFRAGLLTDVLNPKVAVFFLAFLPPFVPAASPSPSPSRTASFLLLGAWIVVQSTIFLFGVVALAGRLRRWQTPVLVRRMAGALAGTLFMLLAWRLLAARPTAV